MGKPNQVVVKLRRRGPRDTRGEGGWSIRAEGEPVVLMKASVLASSYSFAFISPVYLESIGDSGCDDMKCSPSQGDVFSLSPDPFVALFRLLLLPLLPLYL